MCLASAQSHPTLHVFALALVYIAHCGHNIGIYDTHPLHAITGSDLPELIVLAKFRDVGRVGELRVVRGGPEVELARCFRECV